MTQKAYDDYNHGDDDDDPGIIPPVRHIKTRSLEDKYREELYETPFDEMRKEEQLKELDEIIAKLSSSTSIVKSKMIVTPPPSSPQLQSSKYDLVITPTITTVTTAAATTTTTTITPSPSPPPPSPPPLPTTATMTNTTKTTRLPSEAQRANDAIDRMEHYITTACVGSMSNANNDTRVWSSDHGQLYDVMTKKKVDYSSNRFQKSYLEKNPTMNSNISKDWSLRVMDDRRSSDEDDRSRVDSILTLQEDEDHNHGEDDDDDDDDEDDGEDLQKHIEEEIARDCSPVSSCFGEVGTMAGEIYHSVEDNIVCTEQSSVKGAIPDIDETKSHNFDTGAHNSILTTSSFSPTEIRKLDSFLIQENERTAFTFRSRYTIEKEKSESTSKFQPYVSRETGDYPSEEEEVIEVRVDMENDKKNNTPPEDITSPFENDMILQQPVQLVRLASLLGDAANDSDYEEEIADRELDFSLSQRDWRVESDEAPPEEVIQEDMITNPIVFMNSKSPDSTEEEEAKVNTASVLIAAAEIPTITKPLESKEGYFSTTGEETTISNTEIREEVQSNTEVIPNTAAPEKEVQDNQKVFLSPDITSEKTTKILNSETISQASEKEEEIEQGNAASTLILHHEREFQESTHNVNDPHLPHDGLSRTTSYQSYEDEETFLSLEKKESNPYGTNIDFLTNASFGASLLGLGPRISDTNLSNMPQDERLNPPEGIESYTAGSYRPITSTSTFTYMGEPYLIHHSGSISSKESMDPEDMVPKHSDGVNTSHDSTQGTEVNDSREEDDVESFSQEDNFYDEENSRISVPSKDHDDSTGNRSPIYSKERWNRKYYLYFAGGCILVIIFMIIGIVVGTKQNKTSMTVDNTTPNNITPDSNKPEINEIKRDKAFLDLLLSTSVMEGNSSQLLTLLTKEKESAEYKAMKWIIDNDPLSLDPTNQSTQNTNRITQRFALATLFFASLNEQWSKTTNWLNKDECTWYGVTCEENTLVTQINMTANTVAGTLSNEIARLSHLKELILKDNMFEGSIPSTIGTMSRLRVLDLRYNAIRGRLDELELSNMMELEVLDLRENEILGSLPKSLYSLTRLKVVNLEANTIMGTLSTLIGKLTNLERLVLKMNSFIGSLPTQIGTLRSMKTFDISYNEFNGPIPTHIGKMRSLKYFFADENNFSGDVPVGLGRLSNIGEFHAFADVKSILISQSMSLGRVCIAFIE
jgi:hypothetical protein